MVTLQLASPDQSYKQNLIILTLYLEHKEFLVIYRILANIVSNTCMSPAIGAYCAYAMFFLAKQNGGKEHNQYTDTKGFCRCKLLYIV